MREAMWIRAVPSVWNAEAIAIRSRPESRIAQRTISSGVLVSKRALRSLTTSSAIRVCTGDAPGHERSRLGGEQEYTLVRFLSNQHGGGRDRAAMLAGPGRRRARDSPPAVTRTNEEPPAMSTIDTAATPTIPPHGGV